MSRLLLFAAAIPVCLLCLASLLPAAPTPRLGPFDIEGTVLRVQWVPEKSVKGIPGMSGSIGYDRTMPAHLVVTLADYSGIDAESLEWMRTLFPWSVSREKDHDGKPGPLVLRLDQANRSFLREGMRIRVGGYVLSGDESGDYTGYTKVQVLSDE